MIQDDRTTEPVSQSPFRKWGVWAVGAGALALVLVFAQIVGPSFEAKPSAAEQVGEIAGEIKRSAWRSFLGLSAPEPEPVETSIWTHLSVIAPICGLAAVLLSLISGLKGENWRCPAYGLSLGASAIVFQYLWWVALLFAGVILLVAIIENIGDIFSI